MREEQRGRHGGVHLAHAGLGQHDVPPPQPTEPEGHPQMGLRALVFQCFAEQAHLFAAGTDHGRPPTGCLGGEQRVEEDDPVQIGQVLATIVEAE